MIGSMNPADLASRPTVFNDASINEWFNGPIFLQGLKSNWLIDRLWERMIRSTRRILRATSNHQVLDDETLCTLLLETEKIINNRPLCAISDDHRDLDVLTPNKILLLKNNDLNISTGPQAKKCLRQWRRVCQLSQTFRKCWVREYISVLHNRQKWHKRYRNLKNGDLGMVMSRNSNPGDWPLGLVIDMVVSNDGLVR